MNTFEIEQFKNRGGLTTIDEGKPDDLFIVCASYEPRSTAVGELLSEDYRARTGIIYVNQEFVQGSVAELTNENLNTLLENLTVHCDSICQITGSWLDPCVQLESARECLLSANLSRGQSRITLDATTFNREALLTITELIREIYNPFIRIAYVSPLDHGNWLSQGFRCVRNVMGFPGIQQPSKQTLLMVLSGFEPERTAKLIEEHEPSKVLFGIGNPPTDIKFLARNKNEQKLIFSRQDIVQFEFPANDIITCWECLEQTIKPYKEDYNIIIAPMNTKLSSLAVLLTAEHNAEIQISYCVPGEYNVKDYSSGATAIFLDSIPLYKK